MHIRVYNRGWVFTRNGVLLPDAVKLASVAAVKSLCLDFGAVDIGYRISTGKAAVFEVNTAPGIEGTTLKKYAAALKVLI